MRRTLAACLVRHRVKAMRPQFHRPKNTNAGGPANASPPAWWNSLRDDLELAQVNRRGHDHSINHMDHTIAGSHIDGYDICAIDLHAVVGGNRDG